MMRSRPFRGALLFVSNVAAVQAVCGCGSSPAGGLDAMTTTPTGATSGAHPLPGGAEQPAVGAEPGASEQPNVGAEPTPPAQPAGGTPAETRGGSGPRAEEPPSSGSSPGGSSGAAGDGGEGMERGGGGGSPGSQAGGPNEPPEGLTAEVAAAAMGRGVNLGQMFESTQHPRTLDAAAPKIDAYYARGFRNLRIPITWTERVGGDLLVTDPAVGSVNRSHPRLLEIEAVIDHALSKPDLFVVINAHHETTLKTESRAAVLEQLWKDIAEIFADKDHRLVFEILNEPHREDGTAMPAADLRAMTGLAYDQIRSVDPSRIVLFGGNQWFGAHEVPEVWTSIDEVGGGSDPYVMVTFHHYDPWTFCGDNQGTYDDAWTEANQSGPMEQMATWARTIGAGMSVYIGEWGVGWGSRYATLSCNNVRQWYTTFDSVHAIEYGQPTAVWDDGGWFEIFDHGSSQFGNNLVDCILGACEWDGAERFNSGCL